GGMEKEHSGRSRGCRCRCPGRRRPYKERGPRLFKAVEFRSEKLATAQPVWDTPAVIFLFLADLCTARAISASVPSPMVWPTPTKSARIARMCADFVKNTGDFPIGS